MTCAIEEEIIAKGKTAPRVLPADIFAVIDKEYYFTGNEAAAGAGYLLKVGNPLCLLTFCVLVLKNGFTVTGHSACASPENFDPDIGRKIAKQNAINEIWPLLGYELRTKLMGK